MLFLKQSLPAAAILASLVLPAHADPVGCEQNKVSLARVVSKDARLHFIASKSERMPACPSAESACRLRPYVVPGDEVLVDATEAPYLCASFKSQAGRETRGWLPRAALQIAPSEGAPARQWAGKWQRDREAQIVIASHGDEVEVSGDALWGSYDRQRVRRGAVHVGELSGKGRPRMRWPLGMIRINRVFLRGRINRRRIAPPSSSSMAAIWWWKTTSDAAG